MKNRAVQVLDEYHEGTKHPYGALLSPLHEYNPANPPPSSKRYPGAEHIPLELDKEPIGISALSAISGLVQPEDSLRSLDRGILARILYFSAGITKRIRLPGVRRRIAFRAAACTGALYHIEIYVVTRDLPDLQAALYYFDPERFALIRLRRGDLRQTLVEAAANEPSLKDAASILIFTDVAWRNAYKYQARAYRHAFWDSGTILANTLAMVGAHRLSTSVVLSFQDLHVERLLGLEAGTELPVALLPLNTAEGSASEQAPPAGPLEAKPEVAAGFETRYPAIAQAHAASSLEEPAEVAEWREQRLTMVLPEIRGESFALQPASMRERSPDPLEKVIIRRGSTRRFARSSISFQALSTTLAMAALGVPSDVLSPSGLSFNHMYLLVNDVEGLPPGAYVVHPDAGALELLQRGDFRGDAGYLGLNQALPADASVNLFFLTDLRSVLGKLGNRGYRAAQLEASIAAGRAYLAAYAQGFGASGLTFFDDAVVQFFAPHSDGKSVMFMMALGVKYEPPPPFGRRG